MSVEEGTKSCGARGSRLNLLSEISELPEILMGASTSKEDSLREKIWKKYMKASPRKGEDEESDFSRDFENCEWEGKDVSSYRF